MDTINRLKEACATKWTWVRSALLIRDAVLWLIAQFESSPTHVEVNQWKTKTEELSAALELSRQRVEALELELVEAEQKATKEYASLKAKYDKRLRATETDQAEALKLEIMAVRDEKHLIQIELNQIKEQLATHVAEHEKAKEGNRALLRFIHKRHRLNVPMTPNSLRELLQKADENS